MRPRYLEVEGLQSFKELQHIDFDKLGETGLFGIFGPTGSGKSTILDAMTLALYGNVQRAARGTQGIINADMSSVRVAFTFDLLKDGERKSFRVERVYKRKKDSESSVEVKVARLFEVDDGKDLIIADKPGEVTFRVEGLLGLQLDDFTRSVVLPQNKFQEFLLLDKARKRDMMERIFYLEEYGRELGEKVARKLSAVRFKLTEIEGAMSTLGDISEKTLLEAERNLARAKELKDTIDAELKVSEGRFHEAREIWDLTGDLNFILMKEQEHLKQSEATGQKKYLYEKSVRAEVFDEPIKKYLNTLGNLNATREQLEQVCGRLVQVEEQLREARNNYTELYQTAEKERPVLIERKTKLGDAVELRGEIANIDRELIKLRESYRGHKNLLEEKDQEITRKKTELEEKHQKTIEQRSIMENLKVDLDYKREVQGGVKIEEELAAAEKDREQKQLKYEELLVKVSDLFKELEELSNKKQALDKELESQRELLLQHEGLRPAGRDKILADLKGFHEIRMVVDRLKVRESELEAVTVKLHKLDQEHKGLEANLKAVMERKNALASEKESLENEAERLKVLESRNTAAALAQGLSEGKPCPVCGSMSHPSPAHKLDHGEIDSVEQKLQSIVEQVKSKESAVRTVEMEYIRLEEQCKGLKEQMALAESSRQNGRAELVEWVKTLPREIQHLEINLLEEKLAELEEIHTEKVKTLEAWEAAQQKMQKNLMGIEEQATGLAMRINAKQVEYKVLNESLQHQEDILKQLSKTLQDTLSGYHERKKRLSVHSFKDEQALMERKEKSLLEVQKQVDGFEEEIRHIRRQLDEIAVQRQKIAEEFAEIRAQGEVFKAKKDEKESKLRLLAGEEDIERALQEADARLLYLQQQEKALNDKLKGFEDTYHKEMNLRDMLKNQYEIYTVSSENERMLLERLLKEKEFTGIEEVREYILPREQQERMKEEVLAFEEELKRLQNHKDILMKKLDGRTITEEQWSEAEKKYKEALELKENSISQYESAKNQFAFTKSNFDKWLHLNGQRKLYGNKKEMLDQIQKLLKGNSFVEFISEERLRYIAKEASETLGILTKYKYALELDTENGFVIRDNANGGIHRMVSSLSGGETFLTSLSLALALSSQIQLKGQSPLEFFFLDEGFGTLDTVLLDTVMDSLERLSSCKRVIGLISHVPELKSRISRRLIVQPPEPGGKGSRIVLEKA